MTVAGVSMCKDEADVIEGTLRHLADEVDFLLVADNGSTDGTRDILDKLATELPLTVLDDREPGYYQSRKMTALAQDAAAMGAQWVIPFDADELWVFRGERISVVLKDCPADVVTADLFNHFPSGIDDDTGDPFTSIIWRLREPAALPKVAFRYHPEAVIHQGNHGVSLPGNPVVATGMEVRHYPYRTAEQFVQKARNGAAAYAATDLREDIGAHWRGYGAIIDRYGAEALEDVFREHFWALSPADKGWLRDPAPYMRWSL